MEETLMDLEENQNHLHLIRCNLTALLQTAEKDAGGYYIMTDTQYSALNAVELSLSAAVTQYEAAINRIFERMNRGEVAKPKP